MGERFLSSVSVIYFFLAYLTSIMGGGQSTSTPKLTARDRALIDEACNVWTAIADDIWPGASAIKAPLIYIVDDHEYAIGFPSNLNGFVDTLQRLQDRRTIHVRKRTFARDLSASFPFEGVRAVVMGSPEALGKSITGWIITAGHEMFHVFQAANGADDKVAKLEIGPRNDASWQLSFPFPYTDADTMRLIHLQGYLLWLAAHSSSLADAKYNIGTVLDATRVYRSRLAQLRPDGKAFRYSQFQEWNEGVAAYTEFKIIEKAARGGYQPTQAFASLPGFQTYQDLWRQAYENHPFLVKHAGRAAKSRLAFYHLGMGKALALDSVNPSWKQKYFSPGVWLDDLLTQSSEPAN